MARTKKARLKKCLHCWEDVYEDELIDVDPDEVRSISFLPFISGFEKSVHEMCDRHPREWRIIKEDDMEIIWMHKRHLVKMQKGGDSVGRS